MERKKKETCIKCEHYCKKYCSKTNSPQPGYHWICNDFAPNPTLAIPSKINASYAYIDTIIQCKNSYDHYLALVVKLSSDIPSQQLSEKITCSPTFQTDEKVIALMDAKAICELKKQSFDDAFKRFCHISLNMSQELYSILVDHYINGKTVAQMSKQLDISSRTFYRRCNEALTELYPHLDEEYKRLAR